MATHNLGLAETGSRPIERVEPARHSFLHTLHDRTILFRAGDWIYTTYGVFVGLAFFLGVSVALWHDAAAGLSVPTQAMFYLLLLVPLVLVGARGFSILLEWRELFRHPLQTIVKPGYMLHGGVLGGAVAILLYAGLTGNSTLLLLDAAALIAISIVVGLIFGMHRGQVGAWLPAPDHDHPHDHGNVINLPVQEHRMDPPERSA